MCPRPAFQAPGTAWPELRGRTETAQAAPLPGGLAPGAPACFLWVWAPQGLGLKADDGYLSRVGVGVTGVAVDSWEEAQ